MSETKPSSTWRRILAPLAVIFAKAKVVAAVAVKFKAVTVLGSMLVSIAAYGAAWGWRFAVGFVLLLFVHEYGHVMMLRAQGVKASAPLFIPFLGAVIGMKQMPKDAWQEAQVGLAGPVVGSLGATAVWLASIALHSHLLQAIAFVGFLLNLFNLLPMLPLDGGRAVGALHPAFWGLGLVLFALLIFATPNPLILIIFFLGLMETWRRWKDRCDPKVESYYRIGKLRRAAVTVTYLGLAVALAVAMHYSFLQHPFNS